jgi:membrane protein DedA with SNARE-associated domain
LNIINGIRTRLDAGGYPLIAALMAMESTVVPIPSETGHPLRGATRACHGQTDCVGHRAGRDARLVGRGDDHVLGGALPGVRWCCATGVISWCRKRRCMRRNRWAARFGSHSVFLRRGLLPVVRHLIGIPMGIVKMDFLLYSLFTLDRLGVWCCVLAWVGITAGNDPKLLHGDLHHIALWLAGALVVLGSLYYFLVHRYFDASKSTS